MAATISGTSAMRPGPLSPSASGPSLGPTKLTPSASRRARLRPVAGWRHIRVFIAGANSLGWSAAISVEVARSSAMPCAILAMMSAVAGATTAISASCPSLMWAISLSAVSASVSVKTASPAKVSTESGVTNSAPARVRMQRTWAPFSRSRLIRSRHL